MRAWDGPADVSCCRSWRAAGDVKRIEPVPANLTTRLLRFWDALQGREVSLRLEADFQKSRQQSSKYYGFAL